VLKYTQPDWELLLINDGSTDGTRDYFSGLQDAARVPVTILDNARDHGFPAAINQGLRFARGDTWSCSTTTWWLLMAG
jgi:glycosyltransferase involved in cell wall biosynthesis